MKRRVLCVFILVFWALIACTFLSIKIEKQMMPTVEMTKVSERTRIDPETEEEIHENVLPRDSLFSDDMGTHLYQVREGDGWESGTRIYEARSDDYREGMDALIMSSGWGEYVRYATKLPRLGEQVVVNAKTEYSEDTWLFVYPGKDAVVDDFTGEVWMEAVEPGVVPPTEEYKGTQLRGQTDTAALVYTEKMKQPFMEASAAATYYANDELFHDFGALPAGMRVFGLGDVRQFLNQIPKLAGLIGIILFTVIVWAYSCLLTRHGKAATKLLIVNGVLAAATLTGLIVLIFLVNLPSSLLPQNQITQLSHYTGEFDMILSGLKEFTNNATAQDLLTHQSFCVMLSMGFVAAGAVLGVVTVVIEAVIFSKRTPKTVKSARTPRPGKKNRYVPKHAA